MSSLPQPGFIENIKNVIFKNYANFNGRARRSEFWLFYLFIFIVYAVLGGGASAFIFLKIRIVATIFSGILGLFSLGLFIPDLALTVRRLHDTGRSGWFFLIVLIPIVGPFILLYFCVLDSKFEANEYGPSPKYSTVSDSGLTE